ncbi:MAG: hypothetical protein KIT22_09845 [Verrucomicrobiae bacterium]|nr:hypothetical protein [Verrucomicrobiae bacterium]
MTAEEAKRILLACRPGTDDASDPEVRAALAVAERDPVLAAWWRQQRQAHAILTERFREIPVPADLKASLLATRRKTIEVAWWPSARFRTLALAAAAALAALLVVLFWRPAREADTFAQFRDRMVRTVVREYRMDLTTGAESEIRGFLREHQGHPEFQLRGKAAAVPLFGAGRLSWRGNPVSMICLERRPKVLMYLFVIERSALTAPPGEAPEFAEVVRRATASWSSGGLVYVLASEAGPEDLAALMNDG